MLLVLGVTLWFLGWRVYGWYHLNAGKTALEHDRMRIALEHLQAAHTVWPDDPEVLFLLARAARRSGDLALADTLLGQCQTAPALSERAPIERALLRAARGEIDEVGDYCHGLLAQGHPDTPLIIEALIQGCFATMRYGEAARDLQRWLAMSPEQPQALYLSGLLQLHAGNQQEALTLFRQVIQQDSERDDARLQLAGIYLDLGQAREALPHLEILRRSLPAHPMVEVRLARCLDLLARPDDAAQVLDGVLARHPNLPTALLDRGRLAVRAGDLERAEAWLQEACARDPANHEAHYQLFLCLKQRGKTAEVAEVRERMNRIEKDSNRLREISTTDLPQRPTDPALHAEMGEILLRLGLADQAERWLHTALKRDPGNRTAHLALAAHYQALGQFSQAEQHRALAGVRELSGSQQK
jgi:tetratricopeptide (TPR) repeat protein